MKRLHSLFFSPYKIDLQVRSFSHSSLQSSNESTFRMRLALLSLPLRQALKVGVQVPCRVNKTGLLVKICLNLNWAVFRNSFLNVFSTLNWFLHTNMLTLSPSFAITTILFNPLLTAIVSRSTKLLTTTQSTFVVTLSQTWFAQVLEWQTEVR